MDVHLVIDIDLNNQVVGMLLRARKHKIIIFPGEMLYQRRDDLVPIVMLLPLEKIRMFYEGTDDPASCVATK
ncbi:unnamed protein product [Soboliphyme baturini]|uniref:Costars domain-containing protein n=1 Tax=Soboliphyme baturini TaxID=241478 RepID=A0A183J3H8_9BILA|nr:unnamed protein product [Soboliphyme baturini]